MIWKDVMDYIIAYMKECLVAFCLRLLTQQVVFCQLGSDRKVALSFKQRTDIL